MLDAGSSTIGAYASFPDSSSAPTRVLLYNSVYFSGSGTRSVTNISLSGIDASLQTVSVKRLSAPNATSLAGSGVSIGGGTFDENCESVGTQTLESVSVSGGEVVVSVQDSEAVIVYLS